MVDRVESKISFFLSDFGAQHFDFAEFVSTRNLALNRSNERKSRRSIDELNFLCSFRKKRKFGFSRRRKLFDISTQSESLSNGRGQRRFSTSKIFTTNSIDRRCIAHRQTNKSRRFFYSLNIFLTFSSSLGLCRTGEIFGVKEMVLSSLRILDDPLFQNLSMTAHKWLQLKQVDLVDRMIRSVSFFSFPFRFKKKSSKII